ncbi:hypothetical protein INR49_003603 [Caranx melampygus]|nr:hypothetical protein INR49_003603 [Caranx melampygus]
MQRRGAYFLPLPLLAERRRSGAHTATRHHAQNKIQQRQKLRVSPGSPPLPPRAGPRSRLPEPARALRVRFDADLRPTQTWCSSAPQPLGIIEPSRARLPLPDDRGANDTLRSFYQNISSETRAPRDQRPLVVISSSIGDQLSHRCRQPHLFRPTDPLGLVRTGVESVQWSVLGPRVSEPGSGSSSVSWFGRMGPVEVT